jgi:endogenous inhibitor of DNA gyrase (YacG/DUF329 family)
MDSKPKCYCGKTINFNKTATYCEEEYCSQYCREFKLRGLSMIPKSESKHHHNQFKKPKIIIPCNQCGSDTVLKWGGGDDCSNRKFCSKKCADYTFNPPERRIRKARTVFPMLYLLNHERKYGHYNGWMTAEQVWYKMQRRNNTSYKRNPYVSLLSIWAKRGVLDSRKATPSSPTEYRISSSAMATGNPIGKIMVNAAPMKAKRN